MGIITIKSSLYFSYAGELSNDYGIYNVNMDAGLQKELLVPEKSIMTTSVKGRTKPYFQGFEYSQRAMRLNCLFKEPFDDEKIRSVCRWLCGQKYYQPLFFSDHPEKIYYAISNDQADLIHNCLQQGYIELTFVCNDFYIYSPVYSAQYDFSSWDDNTFEFTNEGDVDCLPKLTITKIEAGDLTISNLSNAGYQFRLIGLHGGETVTVRNDERIIQTDIANTYRYDSFNGNYLYLPRGKNVLQVLGKCQLQMDYEFKFLA